MSLSRYAGYSSSPQSPLFSGVRAASAALLEQERYLSELLAERKKLSSFMQVLPHCYAILNKEILRVTIQLGIRSPLDQSGLDLGSPQSSGRLFSDGQVGDVNVWSPFPSERLELLRSPSRQGRLAARDSFSELIVKKTIRVDVPVDKYPTYNFMGRLLGPRGNSLKRIEACTECRIMIRGRGSLKDPSRAEKMRGQPGYEHLNEPLHVLIEAELPVDIIDARLMQAREIVEDLLKPIDEAGDLLKKQQLRELAMLKGSLVHDGTSGPSSPFDDSLGLKRAKTRG